MREYCSENRHMVLFWKLSCERAFDVLLEQMLETVMLAKSLSITQ